MSGGCGGCEDTTNWSVTEFAKPLNVNVNLNDPLFCCRTRARRHPLRKGKFKFKITFKSLAVHATSQPLIDDLTES